MHSYTTWIKWWKKKSECFRFPVGLNSALVVSSRAKTHLCVQLFLSLGHALHQWFSKWAPGKLSSPWSSAKTIFFYYIYIYSSSGNQFIVFIIVFTIGLFDWSIELDIIDNLYIMSILTYHLLLKENSGIDPLKLFDPFCQYTDVLFCQGNWNWLIWHFQSEFYRHRCNIKFVRIQLAFRVRHFF